MARRSEGRTPKGKHGEDGREAARREHPRTKGGLECPQQGGNAGSAWRLQTGRHAESGKGSQLLPVRFADVTQFRRVWLSIWLKRAELLPSQSVMA